MNAFRELMCGANQQFSYDEWTCEGGKKCVSRVMSNGVPVRYQKGVYVSA